MNNKIYFDKDAAGRKLQPHRITVHDVDNKAVYPGNLRIDFQVSSNGRSGSRGNWKTIPDSARPEYLHYAIVALGQRHLEIRDAFAREIDPKSHFIGVSVELIDGPIKPDASQLSWWERKTGMCCARLYRTQTNSFWSLGLDFGRGYYTPFESTKDPAFEHLLQEMIVKLLRVEQNLKRHLELAPNAMHKHLVSRLRRLAALQAATQSAINAGDPDAAKPWFSGL